MYDVVRIYFLDGTETVIYVSEDDEIQDAIVNECDLYGWSTCHVVRYAIEDTISEDELD